MCSNDIFNPGYNRKTLIRKKTSILVLIMNSCFIQYNAPLLENVNEAHEVKAISKELFVFSQLQINFSILEIRVVPIAVYDRVHLVYISLKVDAYLSSTVIKCPFRQEISSSESAFSKSGIC